ncbi:UDP-glucoronosyl and UDP-glucosyl transferase domain-containing protein [Ditylenchus destructor]|nr:UDP-glucoronosyl and UDP-glucosyl transferase domain-containing protein [Ditylenchus destructor]
MNVFLICAYLSIVAANFLEGFKILVFSPTHSKSHMIANGRIADTLAKGGHDVTLLEVEFGAKSGSVYKNLYSKRRAVTGFVDNRPDFAKGQKKKTEKVFNRYQWPMNNALLFRQFYKAYNKKCEELLRKRGVLDELRDEKFDLIFTEQLNLCGTGLKEVLNITTHIWVNSNPIMDHVSYYMGVPNILSYVPAVSDVSDGMSDHPTYFQRIRNIVESLSMVYVHLESARETTEIFRKHFGPTIKPVEEIARDSPLLFVRVDPLVDFPRPILHNTVFIGGLGLEQDAKRDLPEKLENWINESPSGDIVLFSFGSIVETDWIPSEARRHIFDTFAHFPNHRFIMKISKEDHISKRLARNMSNVHLADWLPQSALLRHSRVKAFVTHGGYNSLLESAMQAVPVIVMPFFSDQMRNAKVAERNGWGIALPAKNLLHNPQKFSKALESVLYNDSYTKMARRTQRLLKTKPFSAEEILLRYTQFVGENQGTLPELQNEGRNLNFVVYNNLDIWIPLVLLCLALIYFVAFWMFRIGSWILRIIEMKIVDLKCVKSKLE